MRYLVIALLVLLGYLQYRLWMAEGGFVDVARLNKEIARQERENAALRERNRILLAEVESLKQGVDTLEERARTDMGMVKEGETFFLFLKDSHKPQ
ncbi:MAG TPA: cell division protein FtsB [Cellvibrionaceae bacterium]|nr:cell division protein FtsB [Cellvibrionaceae bacterium]